MTVGGEAVGIEVLNSTESVIAGIEAPKSTRQCLAQHRVRGCRNRGAQVHDAVTVGIEALNSTES